MIAHLAYVRCDGCGDHAQPGDDAEQARSNATAEGYIYREGRDLCSGCQRQAAR